MSELPISCYRCRRRKIKCNKRKPCNQCIKHKVPCQFPSKFRNVSFDEADRHGNIEPTGSVKSESSDPLTSESPADTGKLEEQIRQLQLENQNMREELKRKETESVASDETSTSNTGTIKISGETTEKGEKYYGPLLSNNMAEEFDKISNNAGKMDTLSTLKHHSWTSDPFKIGDDASETSLDGHPERFQKQPLPWVVGEKDSAERNMEVLQALVKNCFETRTYDYFISENKVMCFIEEYALIPEESWEGSDDLLLLHMMLILSLQRLSPTTYNALFQPKVTNFEHLWKAIKPLKKSLFRGFIELRHNLVNESYVTVQAYILCTEWEFIEQRYEESWLMMFHCCSIAYALGLHVVTKSSSLELNSLLSESDNSTPIGGRILSQKSKDGYEDYYAEELPKLRVWFALRNLNSQMCSILGRPNPIMIQVNTVSLPSTSISNVDETKIRSDLTNSQLKLGLSECIRLSNSSVIDSFLKEISIENILTINDQFTEEIDKLSYYLSPQYESLINGVVKQIDSLTDMPTTITRKDVLVDLVILHVNRVKLLEPFVDTVPPNRDALHFIMGSILLFYEHTCELVSEFVKHEIPRILESDEAKEGEIRLDKVFSYRDPLFASFIYQGIVVTFILISLKASDFIKDSNGEFIGQVENQVQMLLGLHTSISRLVKENIHLWSRNNVFLMKKILSHISIMKQAAKDFKSGGQMPQFNGFDYDPQIAEMLGANLKDPFWVVNPENSANFLGISEVSSRNDLPGNRGDGLTAGNLESNNKLRVAGYSDFVNYSSGNKGQNQYQNNANEMPLFVSDQMLEDSQAQYNQMQMEQNYGDAIDIDENGNTNLRRSQGGNQ